MTKAMQSLFLSFCFLFVGTLPAKASSFTECDVHAVLEKSEEHLGQYVINIKKSVITDGTGNVGRPCFSMLTFTKTAEIEGDDIPLNEKVLLKYRSYSGMGAKGPITSKTWTYETQQDNKSDKENATSKTEE